MADITSFLLGRIAEDEADVQAYLPCDCNSTDDPVVYPHGVWCPNRTLAECAAKRAIIAGQRELDREPNPPQALCLADDVLRALASVYADHSEYQQEWQM